MRIILYGNGGAGNHGCEAIVRGTAALLEKKKYEFRIHSDSVDEDIQYKLSQCAEIVTAQSEVKRNLTFLSAYIQTKYFHNYAKLDTLPYVFEIEKSARNAQIAFSIGGDNYCYGNTGYYAELNKLYQKNGLKTVLWGCSVEPDVVENDLVAADLGRYHAIVARESITYEAIKAVNLNTILSPDPAFFMKSQECTLDERLLAGNVIGVNASPMIISNETNKGVAFENYKELIHYLLAETDATIALIPHVVWKQNDDRLVLRQLYEAFDKSPRLILVEDHCAPELKYIISKCCFFIGARTHATIAAYSSGVPTLVVGYSVKARGIARDLFGTEEGYVLPVQELEKSDQLVQAFEKLYKREEELRTHLKYIMPEYCEKGETAIRAIEKLRG